MRQMKEELDLHRLTAAGALSKLEQLLYTAFQGGLNGVWVVHGKGTGVLRREVGCYLSAIFASSPTAEQAALEGAAAVIREMKV